MEYDISLSEALLGFEIAFKHLDDRVIVVKSPEAKVTSPNDLVVVEHEGMPMEKNPSLMGDLYVKLNIIMPTAKELADENVRKQLSALLPPAPGLPESVKKKDADLHRYTASPFDPEVHAQRSKDRSRNHNHMEDDDDEGHGHTAQCRQS
jgi:DnaJ family protein A protein 2